MSGAGYPSELEATVKPDGDRRITIRLTVPEEVPEEVREEEPEEELEAPTDMTIHDILTVRCLYGYSEHGKLEPFIKQVVTDACSITPGGAIRVPGDRTFYAFLVPRTATKPYVNENILKYARKVAGATDKLAICMFRVCDPRSAKLTRPRRSYWLDDSDTLFEFRYTEGEPGLHDESDTVHSSEITRLRTWMDSDTYHRVSG